jgi:predicted NBD/HSP70 family sugar kinase/DNA-binding transcriptional ArsR family regulator
MVVVPAQMAQINRRALLDRLQRVGIASRAELAKALGMSQPTAGKIVDELMGLGLVEEVLSDVVRGRRRVAGGKDERNGERVSDEGRRVGRPGRMLRLDRVNHRFLGIELGVAATKLALLPVWAGDSDSWTIEVETAGTAEGWFRQMRQAAGRLGQREFWGVLVSVPGIVDDAAGRVIFSPNLHWTEGLGLPRLLGRVWEAPVILVQEERALALGQQAVDPSGEDFLLVDFGEGVGGAMIVGGRLYGNPLPLSGELGHTPVIGNRRRCGCGAEGCVETLISTRGLLETYAGEKRRGGSWAELVKEIEGEGIPGWMGAALDATAVVVAGALNVLGLRRVILTGSLTELPKLVGQRLSESIVRGAMWARFGSVVCELAPRRRTAGLVRVGIERLAMPRVAAAA